MDESNTLLDINENLKHFQYKNGLNFGTDAYLLAAFTALTHRHPESSSKKAVELGSGTGIISLLCAAKKRFAKIYSVEIQPVYFDIIAKNTEINNLKQTVIPVCADIRDLDPAKISGEADFCISNPPYMTCNSGKRNLHDEKYIARHEVYGDIRDFCACASRLLKYKGKFCTVYRPDRLCDLFCALREYKLEPKRQIFVYAYPSAEPSMVLTEAVKGASPGLKLYRGLYLSDNREDCINNILSHDAQKIYESCSFADFVRN